MALVVSHRRVRSKSPRCGNLLPSLRFLRHESCKSTVFAPPSLLHDSQAISLTIWMEWRIRVWWPQLRVNLYPLSIQCLERPKWGDIRFLSLASALSSMRQAVRCSANQVELVVPIHLQRRQACSSSPKFLPLLRNLPLIYSQSSATIPP